MKFYKYNGAGNDFIIFDNRDKQIPNLSAKQIEFLCNRNFGIGADGVMILEKSTVADFEMAYFNADGSGGTMCGNGGRCLVAFAKKTGVITDYAKFLASDGLHEAYIDKNNTVKLKMAEPGKIVPVNDKAYFCNTGAPHHLEISDDIENIEVFREGQKIRYSDRYKKEGVNVNFVQFEDTQTIRIRTYERGVENETLACGTGSVAAALLFAHLNNSSQEISVKTRGGILTVHFVKQDDSFHNVWLTGPAEFVFEGEINL